MLRLRLPRAPANISTFKASLAIYARQYRAAAHLRVLDVIVEFQFDMDKLVVASAQAELEQLVAQYVPEFRPQASESIELQLDEDTIAARKLEKHALDAIY